MSTFVSILLLILGIGGAIAVSLLTDEAKHWIRALALVIAHRAALRLPNGHLRQTYARNWGGYIAYICDEERRHLRALREATELFLIAAPRVADEWRRASAEALPAPPRRSTKPRIAVAELVYVERYLQNQRRTAVENGESELAGDLRRMLKAVRQRVAADGSTDQEAARLMREAAAAIKSGSYPAQHLRKLLL